MSAENGTVERVENGWAWVLTERKAGCGDCGHKGSCNMIEGADHMLVKALNSARARVGDSVELFLSTKTKIKSMLILYILPVIGLLVGALSGGSLSRVVGLNENFGTLLFTFMGLALAFILVRLLGARMDSKQELTPAVSRVTRRAVSSPSPGEVQMARPTSSRPRGGQCCSS
jgi:sigma-E factor negative regulatory protein RseC